MSTGSTGRAGAPGRKRPPSRRGCRATAKASTSSSTWSRRGARDAGDRLDPRPVGHRAGLGVAAGVLGAVGERSRGALAPVRVPGHNRRFRVDALRRCGAAASSPTAIPCTPGRLGGREDRFDKQPIFASSDLRRRTDLTTGIKLEESDLIGEIRAWPTNMPAGRYVVLGRSAAHRSTTCTRAPARRRPSGSRSTQTTTPGATGSGGGRTPTPGGATLATSTVGGATGTEPQRFTSGGGATPRAGSGNIGSGGPQSTGGGGSAAHNNMPPYLCINWIIKG